MPKDISNIIAEEFETSTIKIIEFTPVQVDYGRSIEEVVASEGFSATKRVAMNSSNFRPLRRSVETTTICLLQVKGKDLVESTEEIKRLRLSPEDFPCLAPLTRWTEQLRERGVGIVVALGSNSVYTYHDQTRGHIGFDISLDCQHFGLFDEDFGTTEDMWFVFIKASLAKLLSHN